MHVDNMFFKFANFLPETVFITDAAGSVIFLNQVGESIFGFLPGLKSGTLPPEMFFIPEERSRLRSSLGDCLTGSGEYVQAVTALKQDGSTFPVQVYIHPILEESCCVGLVGVIIDTSPKQAVPGGFLTTDQKVQTILDNTQEYWGWVLCDFQGNFLDANIDKFKEFNISKADIVGLNISDFVDEKELEGALQFLQKVKQEGIASGIQHIKMATGEERSYEYKDVAVYEGDEPVAVRIIVRDITNKIRDKRTLEVSEARYQGVFENTGLPTVILEENLLISMVNVKFEELSGYTRSEIEEKMSLSQFIEEETGERIRRQFLDPSGDASAEYECRIISRSGKSYDMIVRFGNISSTRQMIVSFTDITSRKQTEKELKESREHLQTEHIKNKKALKETKERYQMIIENVEDFIFEQDLAGNFTFINDASVKKLGYAKDALLGMNYRQYTLPEEKALIEDYHREIYKTGNPGKGLQHRVVRKDGSVFYVELVSSLMKDSDGMPIGYRGISRDITAMKQAEADLKKSEKKYRDFFENVLDFIFIHDLEGNFIENNARYVTEVGGRPEIIAKSNIRDLMPEKFKPEFDNYLERIRSNTRDDGVISIQTPEGGIRSLEYKNFLIYDEDNRPVSVLGSARDITDHIMDKKALRESKQRYQMILENVGDYIFEIDLAGNFTFVNDALIKESGYAKEELIGMSFRDYTFPEEREIIKNYFHEIFTTEKPGKSIQHRVMRKDGSSLFLELVVSLIRDIEENPIGFRGISRDITERKLAEKILKESEQQLKDIIEGSPIATIVFDRNRQITHWNRACEELTAIKAASVVGKNKKIAEKLINQPILPDFPDENFSLNDISLFYGSECRKSKIVKNAFEIESFFPQLGEKGKWLFLTLALLRDPDNNIIGGIETLLDVTSQKRAEKNLLKMHDALEEKVEERTKELQEVNIALEVLLKKRENDKKKFEDKVAYSIKEILTPHLELLKKTSLDKHQKVYLEILEDNFREIASPFMTMLSDNMQKLTRTEIQVINLIKQNKITKEIADLMGISTRTVETHRDNIRKKFSIKNKKVNLRSFLLNLEKKV